MLSKTDIYVIALAQELAEETRKVKCEKEDTDIDGGEDDVAAKQMSDITLEEVDELGGTSDGDEGWITPSNIHKFQNGEKVTSHAQVEEHPMDVAICTTDFAMQNVILTMGLHLYNIENGVQITSIKTWVLRCHACGKVTRKLGEKFCPACGGMTLLRVSCHVDNKGNFRIFLKKNKKWNTKKDNRLIPDPVQGTSNQKGKQNPILRADQPEYLKALTMQARQRQRDLLDPDFDLLRTDHRRSSSHAYDNIKVGVPEQQIHKNARRRKR